MRSFENTRVAMELPCEASVNGTCFQTPDLQTCMSRCKPPECYWGTYETNKKLCLPIRYNTHEKLNPAFIFRPSTTSTAFMDTSFFPYPAERNNRVFISDRITVENVETGLQIKPTVTLKLPKPYIPQPGASFLPITTRTPVLFYNRDYDSVLRADGLNINWYKAIDFLNENYEAQFLEPVDQSNNNVPVKNNREVLYSDIFRIKTVFGSYLTLPPMFNIVHPRLNDLILSSDIYGAPNLFRLVLIPQQKSF